MKSIVAAAVISILVGVGGVLLSPATASAAKAEFCGQTSANFLSFPTWYKFLPHSFDPGANAAPDDDSCKIDVNIPADAPKILLALFEIILRVGTLVAIGFVIFGGFTFITSDGQPDKAKSARWTIYNALIGLAITVSGVGIVNLLGNTLT